MSTLHYRIKRAGGLPPTTWIGATGCKRKFDPNEEEFIVNETELAICLHHGNFKLVGPASTDEAPKEESESASITEAEPIAETNKEPESEEESEESK